MMALNFSLGQTGSFTLLFFALWHVAHRDSRVVAAGVLGGLLILKPPLAFGFGLLWLIQARRYWKSLAVAGLVGVAVSLPTLIGGLAPWRSFASAISERAGTESNFSQQSGSVAEFLKLLLPGASGPGTLITWGVGIGVAALLMWLAVQRFERDTELLSAAAVVVSVVASPHLLIYDSMILIIPAAVAYRRGALTGDRGGMLALLAVVSIAIGPELWDFQFAVLGRRIGLELPALLIGSALVVRWIEEAMSSDDGGADPALHGSGPVLADA